MKPFKNEGENYVFVCEKTKLNSLWDVWVEKSGKQLDIQA